MRSKFLDACAFFLWEIELHMCGMLAEVFEDFRVWRAEHIVDLMDLVEFIIARE